MITAKNIHTTTPENITALIDECISEGFSPTLALVFTSVIYDLDAISKPLEAKNIQTVGVTTSGEIQDSEVHEDSISIMLLDIDPTHFKVTLLERNEESAFINSQNLAKQALATFEKPVLLVFSSGVRIDGQEVVEGIKSITENKVDFYGGLAGDNLQMQNTYVFTNEKKSDNAILGIIFNEDKISVKGVSTSGWEAVGTEKRITKSEGNVVYSIDNEPALQVFSKYFGLGDIQENDVAAVIGVRFPLQLMRADGTSVLRAPLVGNKEDGSLVFAGTVPEGSMVKFSTEPDFEVIEKTIEQVADFKETQMQDADALLVVSCAARKLSFGPMVEDEIQGVQNTWNAPLIGFFAYGEIGSLKNGTCDFHNETISLIVIKEK